jgi:hypothetical protein
VYDNWQNVTAAPYPSCNAARVCAHGDGIRNVSDPYWVATFDAIFPRAALPVPWYAVMGEHDWMTPGNVSAQLDPGLDSVGGRWHGDRNRQRDFFATAAPGDAAPLLSLFMLDTVPLIEEYLADGSHYNFSAALRGDARYNWTAGASSDSVTVRKQARAYADAQAAWLAGGLAASRATWKLVVGHHAAYSYCTAHGSQPELARLNGILRRGGAHGYINGHDHNLQLVTPLSSAAGTRGSAAPFYLTSGAGSRIDPGQKVPADGSLLFSAAAQGFNSVTLNGSALTLTFYNASGAPLYTHVQAWAPPPACAQAGVLGQSGVAGMENDPRCGEAPPPATTFVGGSPPPAAVAAPFDNYMLNGRVMLPSADSPNWDYMTYDAPSALLFAGRRGDGLCVISVAPLPGGALTPLGCVPNTNGSNGVVFVNSSDITLRGMRIGISFNKYAISPSATVFLMPYASPPAAGASLANLTVLGKFQFADGGPDAAVYLPAIRAVVFTMTDRKPALSALLPYSLSSAALGGRACGAGCLEALNAPVFGAGVDDGGLESPTVINATDDSIWVLLQSACVAARISMRTNGVLASIDLAGQGCAVPVSMALDSANNLLFVACRSGQLPGLLGLGGPVLLVLNSSAAAAPGTANAAVIYRSPIGRHVDGIAYLPPAAANRTGRVFVSCGADATLIIFEQAAGGASYRPLEAVATRTGARTLALDGASRRVFTMAPAGSAVLGGQPISAALNGSEPFYPNRWTAGSFEVLSYTPSA